MTEPRRAPLRAVATVVELACEGGPNHRLALRVPGWRGFEPGQFVMLSPGPLGTFDSILYIDVLEHIEDDRGELSRAAALLRPRGFLVVLSPAHPRLFSEFDAAIGHHRRYTRSTLAAAAPEGLELVRLVYLDSVGLLASLGNRLLLRESMPTPRQIALWDRVMVRLSTRLDPILRHRLGKSVLGVWRRPPGT